MSEKQVTFKNFILIKQKFYYVLKIFNYFHFSYYIFLDFSQNFPFCVGGFGHVRNGSFFHLEKSMEKTMVFSTPWKIAPNPVFIICVLAVAVLVLLLGCRSARVLTVHCILFACCLYLYNGFIFYLVSLCSSSYIIFS